MSIKYRDSLISSFRVCDILITNSGNQPILVDDFDQPISFSINSTVIPNAYIVGTSPACLSPTVTYSDSLNSFIIHPLLLNSGDGFFFRVIALNPPHDIVLSANGRIAGIKEVMLSAESPNNSAKRILLNVVLLLTALVLGFFLMYRFKEFQNAYKQLKMIDAPKNMKRIDKTPSDVKSSLLLIRIDMEEVLLKIGKRVGIKEKNLLRSVLAVGVSLRNKGAITDTLFNKLSRVAPIINREMHGSVTYLTPDEYSRVKSHCGEILSSLNTVLAQLPDKTSDQ